MSASSLAVNSRRSRSLLDAIFPVSDMTALSLFMLMLLILPQAFVKSHISRSHASQFPLLRYPQVPDRTHSLHQSRSLHLTQSRSTSQDFRFWLLPLDTLPWAKGYATTTRGFFKHARADGTISLVGCSITAVRTHNGLRRAPVIFGKSARITIVLG